MITNLIEFPCSCGHVNQMHRGIGMPIIERHCWLFGCECKGYIPDNLKYLEYKYDLRNTDK